MTDALETLINEKQDVAAKQSQIDRAIKAYQVVSTDKQINADDISVSKFPNGNFAIELWFESENND